MKIIAISDVHCRWNKVKIEECDLLISAGDYSFRGEPDVVKDFHKWLDKQPAKHIISVQGNHEKYVESNFEFSRQIALEACPRVHFIDEGLVEIEGLKIWCSAITPWFHNWAWNRYPGDEIQHHWDKIISADVVVTHGPCYGILDQVNGRNAGCPQLLEKILEIKPKVHICGHIHPGYGSLVRDGIRFFNAAICNDDYKAVNPATIIEI
jgi:Icc-related predicted phosphoesterase